MSPRTNGKRNTPAERKHRRQLAGPAEDDFRVLVVDDERLFAEALAAEIGARGITCDLACDSSTALALSAGNCYQAILLDHRLPDGDGIRLIPVLLARQPKCSIIVMTAYEAISHAIQAIRQGADDYLVKQPSTSQLVERVLEVHQRHCIRASLAGWDEHRREGLLGDCAAMQRVREQLQMVAKHPQTPVLLTGETGVGKEVAARYLHKLTVGERAPFLSLDCVAFPASLAESLMFGHEKGAFTGALQTTRGVFEEAADGTVLLDEIGDMEPSLQGKLLRVLESRSFQRVGSVKPIAVRARIVAATNRDLARMVEQGNFRHDLFQRLSVFPIHLPPLRARGRDVQLLAQHFTEFFCSKMGKRLPPLSREVLRVLQEYDFPGNVRELKNMIERAVILAGDGGIEPGHLPQRVFARQIEIGGYDGGRTHHLPSAIDFVPGVDTLESLEKKLIRYALEQVGDSRTEAARLLGISRFQLLRRLQKYGLLEQAGKQ